MKNDIEIYTLSTCPFCTKAKELLRDNYLDYTEHEISDNEMAMRKKLGELFHISGNVTVPQIVINNRHIVVRPIAKGHAKKFEETVSDSSALRFLISLLIEIKQPKPMIIASKISKKYCSEKTISALFIAETRYKSGARQVTGRMI